MPSTRGKNILSGRPASKARYQRCRPKYEAPILPCLNGVALFLLLPKAIDYSWRKIEYWSLVQLEIVFSHKIGRPYLLTAWGVQFAVDPNGRPLFALLVTFVGQPLVHSKVSFVLSTSALHPHSI